MPVTPEEFDELGREATAERKQAGADRDAGPRPNPAALAVGDHLVPEEWRPAFPAFLVVGWLARNVKLPETEKGPAG